MAEKQKGPLSRVTRQQGPESEQGLSGLSVHIFTRHNNTLAKATALTQCSHIHGQTESATPTLNSTTTQVQGVE